MRTIIASILSASLVIAFADTATGRPQGRYRHQRDALEYNPFAAYATPRQLQNERAYERGGYWEHDSSALIPLSRAWYDQKLRESPY
jgi:hypothetical protein